MQTGAGADCGGVPGPSGLTPPHPHPYPHPLLPPLVLSSGFTLEARKDQRRPKGTAERRLAAQQKHSSQGPAVVT